MKKIGSSFFVFFCFIVSAHCLLCVTVQKEVEKRGRTKKNMIALGEGKREARPEWHSWGEVHGTAQKQEPLMGQC